MTHTFNLTKTTIRLVVSHKGKQYKRATGLTIDPSLWNNNAKSLPTKCKDRRVWDKLRLIHLRAEEKEGEAKSESDVLRIMEYAISGEMPTSSSSTKKLSFWEYFDEWANRDSTQIRQKRLCYNNIAKFMGKDFDWNDVDSAFHFRLVQKMQSAGFALNYQWKTVSQLKTVMNEGRKLKYHTNLDFQDFKTKREEPDTVYLTKDEVERLWLYEPKYELERKARDLFLLGVYSCARFSDYSRLSMDMIHDGVIRFTQVKTSASVLVPAAPRLLFILERNGGRAPSLAQQHLNEWIKRVCKAVGIDEKVEVTSSNGIRHTTEIKPKYALVSSHTARRTGVTLLYMTGIPLQQVMLISGHKDEDSIRHYLRLTKEENVVLLKDNPFFK
jgi:integrase